MAYERRQHSGGAVATTLGADITSGDTSLLIAAATGWPDGSVAPFYIVIDAGSATEEKILATTRTTLTLNALTRGVDGTAAAAHSAGASVSHCWSATEADEANVTAHETVGAVTTKGDGLFATGNQAVAREAVGADHSVHIADSAQTTGHRWAQVTAAEITDGTITTGELADGAVTSAKIADGTIVTADLADGAVTPAKTAFTYTAFTPSVTQSAIPAVTVNVARYVQVGKHISGYVRCTVASGAGTASNVVAIQLPATPNDAAVPLGVGSIFDASSTIQYQGQLYYAGSGPAAKILRQTESVGQGFLGAQGFTAALATGDVVTMQFDYESA